MYPTNILSFFKFQYLIKLKELYNSSLRKFTNDESITMELCGFCYFMKETINIHLDYDSLIEEYSEMRTLTICNECIIDKEICDYSNSAESSIVLTLNDMIWYSKKSCEIIPGGYLKVKHMKHHLLYKKLIKRIYQNLFDVNYELSEFTEKQVKFFGGFLSGQKYEFRITDLVN